MLTTRHTTEVAQVTPPTMVVSDLIPGTGHTVKVRAIDWFENSSAWSATTSVSTPLTGPEPLQAPRWADVNNDGLKDEIFGANTGLISSSIVDYSYDTVSYSTWTSDFQVMSWFTFDEGLSWFVTGWSVPEEQETTEIINTVLPVFHFMAEEHYDYAVCRAVTDPLGNTAYYRIGYYESLERPGGIQQWQPSSFWPEDAFYMFPTVAARIAKPIGATQITVPGGAVFNVGVGGMAGTITLPEGIELSVDPTGAVAIAGVPGTTGVPLGGSINLAGGIVVSASVAGGRIAFPGGAAIGIGADGRITLELPSGTNPALAQAVDTVGNLLQTGAGAVISVREVIDAINGIFGPVIQLPTAGPLDAVDLGITAGGVWQLGVTHSDGPTQWFAIVQPPEPQIAVDANRDGTIEFGPNDGTSEQAPYRFWLNDDDDVDDDDPDDAENAPVSSADWLDDKIDGIRDLEDFARLKINLSGIADAVRQGQMRIALEWKGAPGYTGAPGIKLWRNLSPNGGTEYLSDVNVARQHLALREPGTIQGALRYVIPTQYWTDVGLSASQPYGNLLFEGTSAGKDQLVIKLLNADGAEIGEGGGVWLELKNIKSMYERVKATANGAEDLPFPYNYVGTSSVPSPTMGWSPDPAGYAFEPAQGETQTYIVAVHGWNQTYERSVMYAETMFKRLWHRGYKGRFVGFRWPTFTGLSSYNDSEYRAWKCGVSLKQYLSSLPSGYTVNLVAHSMGNIVVGSALEKGAAVANYALLNAAVPAICYDTSGTVVQTGWGYVTPNDDPDSATVALSYQGRLANVSGNLVNFFLPADSALSAWEINNDSPDGGRYPVAGARPHQWPEGSINAGYRYQRTAPAGQKLRVVRVAGERILSSADEAMGFAVQAPSLTVGADGRTRGAIDEWVDMSTYGFGSVHSAEFLFSIQQTREFYAELLLKLRVTTQP